MITAQPYRARPGKRMLTAKASGSVCVDGEWIDIKAGLDRVEAGHPIIQAAPHLFGSATVAAPRVSSPGGVKRVQSWHLRTNADSEADVICLDSRTPRFEVSLGLDLIGKIEREIHDALGFGVVETGGYLLGHAWDYIVMRTGPGPRSQHSADRFTLDDSHVRGWLNENPDLRIVGDWHVHTESRDGVPSDTDLRGWAGHCGVSQNGYLGIIATRGEEGMGFMTPRLHAWVTYREGEQAVCEPVVIRD